MSLDVKTITMTLPIAMRFMGNEKRALENKLNDLISHYVPELDGILIQWSDLNILTNKGMICNDQPYIFWKVSFTARSFSPVEGKVVQGRVHRILKNYFLAVAMNSFTLTVSVPESLLTNDIVERLTVQQNIYFKIRGSADGLYRGEFDQESIELTRNLMKQEAEKSSGDVYEYAKHFEY